MLGLLGGALAAQPPLLVQLGGQHLPRDHDDAWSIVLADLDGDGRPEVLIGAVLASRSLTRLYRNSGAATFTQMGVVNPGDYLPLVADFDGDGDGDGDLLIAAGQPRLLLNDGRGGLLPSTRQVPLLTGARVVGDIDGDGDLDLVAQNAAGVPAVFLNDGIGNLVEAAGRIPLSGRRTYALLPNDRYPAAAAPETQPHMDALQHVLSELLGRARFAAGVTTIRQLSDRFRDLCNGTLRHAADAPELARYHLYYLPPALEAIAGDGWVERHLRDFALLATSPALEPCCRATVLELFALDAFHVAVQLHACADGMVQGLCHGDGDKRERARHVARDVMRYSVADGTHPPPGCGHAGRMYIAIDCGVLDLGAPRRGAT